MGAASRLTHSLYDEVSTVSPIVICELHSKIEYCYWYRSLNMGCENFCKFLYQYLEHCFFQLSTVFSVQNEYINGQILGACYSTQCNLIHNVKKN